MAAVRRRNKGSADRSPACPFQTPITAVLYMLRDKVLHCSFARDCLQSLFGAFQRLPPWRCPSTRVVCSEAQAPDQNSIVVPTKQYLHMLDIPTSNFEAPSIMWLFETSTDPEVFSAAASLVSHVDWPLDLDVSDMLRQLCDVYTTCLASRIKPYRH
ncbi:hypothetical protein BDR04DRAFT_1193293 [Suillus decipiens]|nr:hypothetical protein BDR04DRAFT_1193293 [Suillus decipiens]